MYYKKYILLTYILLSSSLFAHTKIIKMGAFNYYPAIYKDTDGSIKGFYVDALSDIEKKEKLKFEYVYGSWNECLNRIKNGEIDVIPSVAKTPERMLFLDFAQIPLLTVWGELYVPYNSSIDGLNDLHNRKIAIMKDDYNGRFFSELTHKIELNCIYVEFSDFEEIFKAIADHTVDAGMVNNSFGVSKFREYNLKATGVILNPFDIYFAVKKGKNKEVLNLLNHYLEVWKIEKNSVYNAARQKWSHGTIGKIEVMPKWLAVCFYVLGILLVLFMVFILLLRNQVKQATMDIISKKEILRLSEAKFKNFVNYAPFGIFLLNENGSFLDVNPAASTITGYSHEELLKIGFSDISCEDCKGNSRFKKLIEEGIIQEEVKFIHKNGSLKWWSINGIKLSDNVYLYYVNDINTLKSNELILKKQNEKIILQNEELQRAKEKAEISDRLKTAFLQNMSHEIRTPMNAIMGFSEILPKYFNDKEKLIKFSTIIKQRGNDLVEIINDILDIAKIESGLQPLHIENCNLHHLIGEIEIFFKEYKLRMHKESIQFNIHKDPAIQNEFFLTDAVKLKQILINLITNAFKFTKEGNIVLECKYEATKSRLLFIVSDSGIGIPSDKHEEIFERFSQIDSDTSRIYGGTGLGLPIVKGLLKLLNGNIWLESELEKGSRFYFTIPCDLNKIEIPEIKRIRPEISTPTPNTNILIVEDDLYNCEFLKEILEEAGYNTISTEYGEKAIEICKKGSVDLVLMDIRIIGMQGIEAIKYIRELNPEIKIIAQTAYAAKNDKDLAMSAGSNDYISKPINRILLLQKIENCLNKN